MNGVSKTTISSTNTVRMVSNKVVIILHTSVIVFQYFCTVIIVNPRVRDATRTIKGNIGIVIVCSINWLILPLLF